MCIETISSTEGRYKVWIISSSGTNTTGVANSVKKLRYDNIPIFNVDPKYTKSLVFVKSFFVMPKQQADLGYYVISVEGKSFPNNFQTQKIDAQTFDELDAINSDSNSRILSIVGSDTNNISGCAKDNGILCGNTFINSGPFTISITGLDVAQIYYYLELEIQLIENVKTLNPNIIKH